MTKSCLQFGVLDGLLILKLWTDCYLAALARFRNCRVVSFDQHFHRFPKLDFLDLGLKGKALIIDI